MAFNFHGLPPAKRFRHMHQHHQELNLNDTEPSPPSCLPAKKRKGIDFPLLPPNSSADSSYCLPAKKRVWALPPFDLNLEWNNLESPVDFESSPGDEKPAGSADDDDGVVCAVCGSTDGDPTDPIVLCDGCDLMVHSTCYGHPLTNGVPDGDWFCAQCIESRKSPEQQLSCCLCPHPAGALKPTTGGRWAHLVCAIYVPEVFFLDPENRDGIDCGKVAKRRWEQRCYICESKKGCVVNCSEPGCSLGFHVGCGLEAELCFEYRQGRNRGAVVASFCRAHTDLWKKQEKTGKFKIVARDASKR